MGWDYIAAAGSIRHGARRFVALPGQDVFLEPLRKELPQHLSLLHSRDELVAKLFRNSLNDDVLGLGENSIDGPFQSLGRY